MQCLSAQEKNRKKSARPTWPTQLINMQLQRRSNDETFSTTTNDDM